MKIHNLLIFKDKKMTHKPRVSLALLLSLFAVGTAMPLISKANSVGFSGVYVEKPGPVPMSLEQVQKITAPTAATTVMARDVRGSALREAALSYGARAGLARRTYDIRRTLETVASRLDAIYNFRALMLPDNVLPPVLTQADQAFKQSGDSFIRLTDKIYQINAQARFVSVQPNWRDYLFRSYGGQAAEAPPASLQPRDEEERKAWAQWVAEGWKEGVAQADRIFDRDLSRLKRDYEGMVLYLVLQRSNMVSLPYVAKSDLGVTGDGKQLNINDSVLRITEMPQFNHEADRWLVIPR